MSFKAELLLQFHSQAGAWERVGKLDDYSTTPSPSLSRRGIQNSPPILGGAGGGKIPKLPKPKQSLSQDTPLSLDNS